MVLRRGSESFITTAIPVGSETNHVKYGADRPHKKCLELMASRLQTATTRGVGSETTM